MKWGLVPRTWREATVAFIPKPGKTSYALAKSFRPICLTSFVMKTFERLIDWYLKERVIPRFPFSKYQFAYQAGLSTTTALHELVSRVEQVFYQGRYALGIFIDVEGAFSEVPTEAMDRGMVRFKTPEVIRRWVLKALYTRRVAADSQGVSRTVAVTRGTAQGGVLSPTIWNMTIDGLLAELGTRVPSVHAQAFSDD